MKRISYANVTATLALFVALGGTSYAVTKLPRSSVGAWQLKTNSVRAAEIQRGAVRSSEIENRSIRLSDVSLSARQSLQGQIGPQGPAGPTFSVMTNALGLPVKGNATGSAQSGFGVRLISFSRSVATCVASASLAGGAPATAHVLAETLTDGRVRVSTFDSTGAAQQYPFNLVVAC
jgi:hypothetical protein